MTTIEEFRKTATPEQIEAIDKLAKLHKEGLAVRDAYEDIAEHIDREYRLAHQTWGLQTTMVDAELELFVDPLLPVRDGYADRHQQIREEMTQLLRQAVGELNTGHLGYVQRNYEKITGEPMPNTLLP